jgi:hypothetical protein
MALSPAWLTCACRSTFASPSPNAAFSKSKAAENHQAGRRLKRLRVRCGDRSQTDGVGLRQVSSCALRRERKDLSAISAWHRAAADDDGRLHEKPVRGYEIVRAAFAGACGPRHVETGVVSPVPARIRAVPMNMLAFLSADTHRERTKPRESAARSGTQKTPRKRGFSIASR